LIDARPSTNNRGFPESLWLVAFCFLAVFLHVFVGFTLYCGNTLWSLTQRPLIDLDNVMEVSMVVLPKSPTEMVHRATQAPTPTGQKTATHRKVITPPRQSDLVIKKKDAKTNQGDNSAELRRLILLNAAKSQADAPEASETVQASDPNSTTNESFTIGTAGQLADPELARYIKTIQELFHKNFNPLPTIVAANPKIECKVHVRFDMNTGTINSIKMIRSSGNASYDGAAKRAIESVQRVPLTPARFTTQFTDGYLVVFP